MVSKISRAICPCTNNYLSEAKPVSSKQVNFVAASKRSASSLNITNKFCAVGDACVWVNRKGGKSFKSVLLIDSFIFMMDCGILRKFTIDLHLIFPANHS